MFNIGSKTVVRLTVVVLLILTGSLNTIALRYMDMEQARGTNPREKHKFTHPFVQTGLMFLGELMCLFIYEITKVIYKLWKKDEPRKKDTPTSSSTPLWWAIPAVCDLTSTTLILYGLMWTYSSTYQMLRGSVILFTAFLSVTFLSTKLLKHHWFGMVLVVIGLVMVGLSDSVKYLSTSADVEGLKDLDKNYILSADMLIVMGQIILALQMVIEEKLLKKYHVHPLKAVGFEGIFGFVILCLLFLPLFNIPWNPTKIVTNQMEPRFEDILDAMTMILYDRNLLLLCIGFVASITVFNVSGITITKTMNATTRVMLEASRTILVWVYSVAVWHYPLRATSTIPLVGYAAMIIGTCFYHNIVFVPLFKKLKAVLVKEDGDAGNNVVQIHKAPPINQAPPREHERAPLLGNHNWTPDDGTSTFAEDCGDDERPILYGRL